VGDKSLGATLDSMKSPVVSGAAGAPSFAAHTKPNKLPNTSVAAKGGRTLPYANLKGRTSLVAISSGRASGELLMRLSADHRYAPLFRGASPQDILATSPEEHGFPYVKRRQARTAPEAGS
jgi:hypothetical protein